MSVQSSTDDNVIHVPPVVAVLLTILIALIAMAMFGGFGSLASFGGGSSGPAGSVGGSLSKSCDGFQCTSPDAARALQVSDVWCMWSGSDVIVHASLTNTMAASVKLSITPKYTIKNGGQHGTSLGSDIPLALAAGASTGWIGNAGTPEGVAPGTPIGSCSPHLHDIDIANISP